ncbi:hypothetical protein MSU_0745 [Mycoplasma suis str. Illinois]|uniref:Uncharacterized protein n=1 Tax=Mycoplasma suis (strain Illinois) TaxID=768700 RepID=F0QS00_MYCSL|nr:hypothetical protein MSU_0745 [Mycoplasma suis str. Illinois]
MKKVNVVELVKSKVKNVARKKNVMMRIAVVVHQMMEQNVVVAAKRQHK